MKRLIVALLVGGALFATVAFAAASLTLNAGNLSQSAVTAVSNCAVGYAVDLDWNTTGHNPVKVDSVDVDTHTANCHGATATVEIYGNGSGFQGSANCAVASGGKCTADFNPNINVNLVDSARVTLAGP